MKSTYSQKPIGEVLRLEYGKPLAKSDRFADGVIPAYGANGVLCWTNKAYRENQSIIVGRKGSAGEINLTEGPFWPTDVTYFVEHNVNETNLLYLYHLLKYLQLPKLARGVKPGINRNDVYAIDVPIPLLSEQKRIVAILDEAFEGIDAAIANTQKNLSSARELFEVYLNDVFTRKGEGWEEVSLEDVCDVRDGTHDSPKYVVEGIPFVTQKNIRKDGLSLDKVKYISDADHEKFYKRSNVAEGDILISMIGVNRGMVCLVDDSSTFSIKNVGLIKKSEAFEMSFLVYYLKSRSAKAYVESESRGGAQPFIGLRKLRSFPVVVAPLNVQKQVVKTLDNLEKEAKNINDVYQQKLDYLNELKQSLLEKAFSGELAAKPEKILKEAAR